MVDHIFDHIRRWNTCHGKEDKREAETKRRVPFISAFDHSLFTAAQVLRLIIHYYYNCEMKIVNLINPAIQVLQKKCI